jgi:hypothetical protein
VRWPRRRWGFEIVLRPPNPNLPIERNPWHVRWWTEAGAERAAAEFIARFEGTPGERYVSAEVRELGPFRASDWDD